VIRQGGFGRRSSRNVVILVVSDPDHYGDHYKMLQRALFPMISGDIRGGTSRAASQQVIEIRLFSVDGGMLSVKENGT